MPAGYNGYVVLPKGKYNKNVIVSQGNYGVGSD
jgi:hypothetical protein